MPQLFGKAANTAARAGLVGILLFALLGWWSIYSFGWSPFVTQQYVARVQPVPFSHEHHAGRLGIDCRYCHTQVETSAFAGLPPTKTCMNCHQQIWFGSQMLEPVRASYRDGEGMTWQRVHNLQQFVYFDHSIHVNKGVGCVECHGRIDEMPLTLQHAPLLMSWCLDCHRNPKSHLRPRDEVVNMKWQPAADDVGLGDRLVHEYQIQGPTQLTSCSTCHR